MSRQISSRLIFLRTSISRIYNGKLTISFCGSFPVIQKSNIQIVLLLGRSNVGKSSFLNFFAQHKVARCAKKPGATKLLNYYLSIYENQKYYLIDTPGYGYHTHTNKKIISIGAEIVKVIQQNKHLKVILLIDSRRGLGKLDFEITDLLNKHKILTLIVLTKCDKLNQGEFVRIQRLILAWNNCQTKKEILFHSNTTPKYQKRGAVEHFILNETRNDLKNY